MNYFDDVKGKTIIITGGTKGIGRGCAQVFCEARANVVICARGEKEGIALANELNEKTGGRCLFYKCDVYYPEQIKNLVEFTVREFGSIYCLINNCGYLPKRRPLDELEVEDFEHVLRVNLISMFMACKYALPHIRKSKGNIINMSSIIGVTGQEGSVMYTSIKAAILTLTKSLAIDEARHGVRVNAVVPGHIETEMYETEKKQAKDPLEYERLCSQNQWLGRGGRPLEVGYACLYLASSMASFNTGSELYVTGGFELGNGPKVPYYDWDNKPL